MTTGNIGSFPLSPLTAGSSTFWKGWNGGDGKYEVVDGFGREKWNGYSADVVLSSVKQPYFRIFRYWKPNPADYEFINIPVSWNNGLFNFDEPQYYSPAYRPLSECLSEILERVKGHDFNLGVELGQLGQTVGLLAGTLSKLGRAALSLKRGDFANAARCLGASPRVSKLKTKDISGRWLELQYGWIPLIQSSYEAMKAFEAISAGPQKVLFRVSKRRLATFNLSTAPTSYDLFAKGYVRTNVQYEMYEQPDFFRQLGLEDPASVAWELTPWSFVVDWFLPFGEYLSLINQIPKLKGRWLITSTIKCETQQVSPVYKQLGAYIGGNWAGTLLENPSFRWGYTKVLRQYQEAPPQVPFPKFKQGLNSSRRFWNAISLAHQRFL